MFLYLIKCKLCVVKKNYVIIEQTSMFVPKLNRLKYSYCNQVNFFNFIVMCKCVGLFDVMCIICFLWKYGNCELFCINITCYILIIIYLNIDHWLQWPCIYHVNMFFVRKIFITSSTKNWPFLLNFKLLKRQIDKITWLILYI